MSSSLQAGASLGVYRIERLLGRGGMGAVYLARDERLGRRVALKVLAPDLADDERFRERFLREWRVAASLEHPHIVPIYDAGDADGRLYIAMRYVEGTDLKRLIKEGPLEPTRTLGIISQVASALDAAHARGLVHRDVKPANVLLDEAGNAYLCDFGLTKNVSSVSGLTGTGQLVGTLEYMAPEAIRAQGIDGRTDQYSLACVLYECLTGKPPLHRESEAQVLWAHVEELAPPPTSSRPELPKALDRVVAVGMAKDPDSRYPTCGDFAAAALAAISGLEPSMPTGARAEAVLRTFMVADIRGYTRYTQANGDEAGAKVAGTFAALVDEVVRAHGGTLQELRGDEALVVFDSARSALRTAVELQRRIGAGDLELPVGIGLDAGEAVPVAGGYRGGALNLAARLCSLAGPGEVLASDGVVHLARRVEGVRYGERRHERLKGFEKPVPVLEVHSAETRPVRHIGRKLRRALYGTRPRLRIALVAVAAALIAAALAIVLTRGGGEETAQAAQFAKDTIGLLDAQTLEPVGTFDTLGAPAAIWPDPAGNVWTLDVPGRLAARIDPRTRQITARIPFGINPGWPAFGAGSFWLGDFEAAAVNRYDPQYGTLTTRIKLPTAGLEGDTEKTEGMAFADGSLWVAYGVWPFRVARIDARTNRVTKTFDFPRADGAGLIAYGEGGLWVVSRDSGRMWRIDPETNTVAATAKLHGGFVEDFIVARGYAWAPLENDRGVWKVDASGNVLAKIETGDLPWSVSATEGRVWVPNANSGTITRIGLDDKTRTVSVGHRPVSAVEAGGLVWVSLEESAADAVRGLPPEATARVVVEGDPYFNTDPVVTFPGPQWQLQYAVGARLLGFPDQEEPAGATLMPELSELPEVSADGRTYTFRIRPGFRFSPPSGEPVTAETMRFTIERALSPKLDPGAQGFTFVKDIVGAKAYHGGKAEHVAGLRVEGDLLHITLVRPAPDFPTRISAPYFTAVPLGTPIFTHGVEQPLPSAGPYYVSSHVFGSQLVLRRNPNYEGPRPHRLEAIVIANSVRAEAGAASVERGETDYTFVERRPLPADLAPDSSLGRRFGAASPAADAGGQRYFLAPQAAIDWIRFNTTSGIFRDARLRRAVNYALDRPALAALSHSYPSDALLPPGIPGAGGKTIYPLDGPDLARARALARGRGGVAVLLHQSTPTCPGGTQCAQAAQIVKRDLARIGIDVRVRAHDDLFGELQNPKTPFDLLLIGWYVDFADPANFVNGLLDFERPLGYGFPEPRAFYDDRRYITLMRAANRLSGDQRASAYRDLVADLMRESPPGAVYQTRAGPAQFFSDRVDPACVVNRPQDGGVANLAALCLREE